MLETGDEVLNDTIDEEDIGETSDEAEQGTESMRMTPERRPVRHARQGEPVTKRQWKYLLKGVMPWFAVTVLIWCLSALLLERAGKSVSDYRDSLYQEYKEYSPYE